ncbi:MAG TPA: OsmC family protein [Thermoplasmata archaeon]|nr:OsmC family protein [Thermoplasmata archaeon]
MRAHGTWARPFGTRLDDGRNHEVVVDLPTDEDGNDRGASALELNVLSLAGCITTIFALVAERRRLPFDSMEIDLDAERPPGSRTITAVSGTLRVTSRAAAADVETALEVTLRTCPVGVLYERAQVPVRVRAIVVAPPVAPAAPTS